MRDIHDTDLYAIVHASGVFGNSERQANLFKYLLDYSLSDKSDVVKEYSIAVDVFGRPESFNPTTDSIVRVEMHRLRKNLKEFSSASSDYTVFIPPASFEVVIDSNVNPASKLLSKGLKLMLPIMCVAVALFWFNSTAFKFESGLTSKCSKKLPNLIIQPSLKHGLVQEDQPQYEKIYADRLKLTISQQPLFHSVSNKVKCDKGAAPSIHVNIKTYRNDHNIKFVTQVTTPDSGEPLLVKTINLPQNSPQFFENVTQAATQLGIQLGSNYSKVTDRLVWDNQSNDKSFRCILTAYEYMKSSSTNAYNKSYNCLMDHTTPGQTPSEIELALLAQLLIQQQRGYAIKRVENPLIEAQNLLARAKAEGGTDIEVLSTQLWIDAEQPMDDFGYQNRILTTIQEIEQYAFLNPNSLELASYIAGLKAGNWELAKSLSDKSLRLKTHPWPHDYIVQSIYPAMNSDYPEAIEKAELMYSKGSKFNNLIMHAIAIKAKHQHWIDITSENLKDLGLDTADKKISYIKDRKFEPKFELFLVSSIAEFN